MSVMLNSLPFLWQGLLVTLHVSALVVVIALGCGVLLGLGLELRTALDCVAGPHLQRRHPRLAAAGADLLDLLHAAADRLEREQFLGRCYRPCGIPDRACHRSHARRRAVDPARPARGRQSPSA